MITLILTLIQLAASLVLIVLQLIALEDQKVSAAESLYTVQSLEVINECGDAYTSIDTFF